MSWLKEVIVEIAETALIITAVLLPNSILTAFVGGYTVLILIAKGVAYFGDNFMNLKQKAQSPAPEWFLHILYAINTIVLFSFQWWIIGCGWALIWLLSYLIQQKNKQ